MTRKRLPLLCLFLLLSLSVPAQTLESLRDEIEQAEAEIKMTNNLLSKTQQDKKLNDKQLKLIRNKITNRKNIIANLEKQSDLINNDIGAKNNTVQSLQQQLAELRKEYGKMVYSAYKNYKLNNFMVFLFSSKDFNDATRRISYMRRYNRMREQKAAEIDSVAASVHVQLSELQSRKEELGKVQQSRSEELRTLGKDESQYKAASDKLTKEAGKLNSVIRENRKKIDRMQQQMRRMIAAEAKKSNTKPRTAQQDEYIAELSGKFDQNKGRLPYPVRGVIVDRFGISHQHNLRDNLVVYNDGVNIASDRGADVRSVFEGEVLQIAAAQGMNNVIIIRHGNYITGYSNVEAVSVKPGDKVSTNQTIGRLPSDDENAYLHFELWKIIPNADPQKLDPQPWLRR